ncbi:MAG: OsmC family protein [Hoeflea sp.]|uniref:OsmC family protein n=1 Tax=Hoeflea sp. TaxID=1940281 RepID=UPI003EF463DF
MATDEHIVKALAHVVDFFEKKPAMALDTTVSNAVLTDGLKCTVVEGDRSMDVDMSPAIGGEGAGPSPGFLGRAALGSCVAIGLKIAALRAGVAIERISVAVEMDWDDRGLFGMGDAPAGATAIRLAIKVESPAAREAVDAAIRDGLKNDPWLQTYIEAQTIEPLIEVVAR